MENINETFTNNITNCDISEQFLLDLATAYVAKNGLFKYVYSVNLNGDLRNKTGHYDEGTGLVSVDINKIASQVFTSSEGQQLAMIGDTKHLYSEVYIHILMNIYHELVHAKQIKILEDKDSDNYIKELLCSSHAYRFKDQGSFYQNNHDLFPNEHAADAEAAMELVNLSKKIRFGFDINQMAVQQLTKDYRYFFDIKDGNIDNERVVGSTEQFFINGGIRKMEAKPLENTYESLIYGLPITPKSYRIIEDYKNGQLPVDDIKTLLKGI